MVIYDIKNAVLLDIAVDDTSIRSKVLNGENTLTLNYALAEHKEIPLGAWCVFKGERYSLMSPEDITMNHRRSFEYTLTMHSEDAKAKLYKFINPVDGRLKFSLTAKPVEHLQMFVDNMNERDSGWTIGECPDHVEVVLSYNHTTCHDALVQLANELELDHWFVGKSVSIGKLELNKDNPLPLSYGGDGAGLKPNIKRNNYSEALPVEILYTQGSETNIDRSKYGTSELHLPKSQSIRFDGVKFEDEEGFDASKARSYIVDGNGYSVKRSDKTQSTHSEDSLDCTEIYPAKEEEVVGVEGVNDEKHFYDIHFDTKVNYSKYLIAGETPRVIFQSGMLAGKEFDLATDENGNLVYEEDEQRGTWKVELCPKEEDGITMPDKASGYMPAAGDKFKVFGIQLPDEYICDNTTKSGAEWDMLRYAVKYLYEHEEPQYTITGELDEIYAKREWDSISDRLVLGSYISFTDKSFQSDPLLIRIVGIKEYVNKPYSPVLEISNASTGGTLVGALNRLENQDAQNEDRYRRSVDYTKRRWRDTRETLAMLASAFDNFSSAISPVTVETMAMLVGDEMLQFIFTESLSSDTQVEFIYSYDSPTGIVSIPAESFIKHMTLGISSISPTHESSEYRRWSLPASTHALEAEKSYYIYAKVSKTSTSGEFVFSETALKETDEHYYLLVGIMNSEYEEKRSFASMYGFTEILPARITTDKVVSSDGETYFDLKNGEIGGRINFKSGSSGLDNVAGWKDMETKVDATIKGVSVEYAVGDSATIAPETGWQTEAPERKPGQYLWQRTATTTNGGTIYSTAICISGIDGDAPYIKDGSWWIGDTDLNVKAEGVDGDTPKIGPDGNWVINGIATEYPAVAKDGVGISEVQELYAVTQTQDGSGVGTWYNNEIPSAYGPDYPYLWNKEKIIYTNGESNETVAAIVGVWGKDGADGRGIVKIENVYQLGTSPTEAPSGEWSKDPMTPTDEYPYLWNKELITYTDSSEPEETEPAVIGVKGDKGTAPHIDNTTGTWWVGDQNTGIVARGEDGKTPEIGENGNWWMDGKDTGYPAKAVGVKSVEEWYLATETQSTPSDDDGGWTLNGIPEDFGQSKSYLWNKEIITGTDGSIMSTVIALIGVWGQDGKGITSVENYYAISASGDAAPSFNEFTTAFVAPTTSKPYLWNYEKVYYTEGEPTTTAPAIIGVMGATIVSVTELYFLSSSYDVPAAPTAEVTEKSKVRDKWTQTCPDWENGCTYFTCSQILRSDGVFTWSEVVMSGNIKNHVFHTAEGEHPLPPYNVGDIWCCSLYSDAGVAASISQVEAETMVVDTDEDGNVIALADANATEYRNEILVCINGREAEEAFSINDWQPAADYAHDGDYAYLKKALPETSAVIDGGLVLGTFLGVTDAEEGSASDGNVVAGLCGVKGKNGEFYDAQKGKLLMFAGAKGMPLTSASFQVWDSGLMCAKNGSLEGLTTKGLTSSFTRNPFIDSWDFTDIQSADMVFNNDTVGASYTLGIDLDWSTMSSGRRMVLVGKMHASSPSGQYFYDNGKKLTSLSISQEAVELVGLGTETEFLGWVVMSRTLFQTTNNYGRQLNTLALGRISAEGNLFNCRVAQGNTNDVIANRTGNGIYTVTLPLSWFKSTNEIHIDVTGYGNVSFEAAGDARDEYPIYANVNGIARTDAGYVITVKTFGKGALNDGSFFFKIYNIDQW